MTPRLLLKANSVQNLVQKVMVFIQVTHIFTSPREIVVSLSVKKWSSASPAQFSGRDSLCTPRLTYERNIQGHKAYALFMLLITQIAFVNGLPHMQAFIAAC
jgi:hypothetical protein